MRDPAKVAWLSQTTLSVDETTETVAALRKRFPLLLDPPSDDICYATQNRQVAVKQIAAESDVVIVVGSVNSSNSVRLVEVARDAGARAAYLVDDASGVDAGVAGRRHHRRRHERRLGARRTWSTAFWRWLAESGFADVEEVEAVHERMVFGLPRELRKPAGGTS